MADIRYVVLSDLHFGAATSLLTNLKIGSDEIDGTQPSPVLVKLVECLRLLIHKNNKDKSKKPILILNGDLLELALADDQDAAMAFERFIELIMGKPGKMFEQIIFIPGNHDHHLWEKARESQYVDYISAHKKWRDPLESPWHTTHMFSDPVLSYFLTALVRRRPNLKKFTIPTYYPNYGLISSDGKRCVVFHHGHFVESIYRLLSTLKTMLLRGTWIPSEIWNLEAENFAWMDFFWSTLGRSGAAGRGWTGFMKNFKMRFNSRSCWPTWPKIWPSAMALPNGLTGLRARPWSWLSILFSTTSMPWRETNPTKY